MIRLDDYLPHPATETLIRLEDYLPHPATETLIRLEHYLPHPATETLIRLKDYFIFCAQIICSAANCAFLIIPYVQKTRTFPHGNYKRRNFKVVKSFFLRGIFCIFCACFRKINFHAKMLKFRAKNLRILMQRFASAENPIVGTQLAGIFKNHIIKREKVYFIFYILTDKKERN